jgi:putative spermidine/putrescine transport system ATP-binding protein
MSNIALDRVTKRYGSLVTVDDLDLEVRHGEFLALLGPSGCGKTTTLRMIAGLTLPDGGSIHFGDRDVTNLPPYLRNAGLVFQGYALFPHMSVSENVAFGLQMRKVGKAEADRRVRGALELVRMEHLADRLPKQLSGGQQQRVALARAIVYEPDALLLDEPLSALDAKLRNDVRAELRRLQQALGLTTVFVTHDQDEAISAADRIVVMSNGRIEQIGTPKEIYERPANLFVAEFIGASNFLPGEAEGADRFRLSSGQVIGYGQVGTDSKRKTIAIRPEHILLRSRDAHRNEDAGRGMPATVENIIYRGNLTEIVVSVGGHQLTVHRQNGQSSSDHQFARGDAVVATWQPDAAVLL